MTAYCQCEVPVIDVEHDAGCRRCGLPVDFSPANYRELLEADYAAELAHREAVSSGNARRASETATAWSKARARRVAAMLNG